MNFQKPLPEQRLQPINGQQICQYANKPFGWKTMSYNGCVVIAIYNALLRKGQQIPLEQIHSFFHRPWRGRLLGVRVREIRSYLRATKIPYTELHTCAELEQAMEPGDLAIVMRWNRTVPYCHFTMGEEPLSVIDCPDPFGGAHGVAVERMEDGGFRVYNRYSNRNRPYDYEDLEQYMGGDASFMSAFLLQV